MPTMQVKVNSHNMLALPWTYVHGRLVCAVKIDHDVHVWACDMHDNRLSYNAYGTSGRKKEATIHYQP